MGQDIFARKYMYDIFYEMRYINLRFTCVLTYLLIYLCLQWEAFSLPELESFLLILHKEEEAYLQEIRETYHVLRIQMQQRINQLRQDRIGPGARLKPLVT